MISLNQLTVYGLQNTLCAYSDPIQCGQTFSCRWTTAYFLCWKIQHVLKSSSVLSRNFGAEADARAVGGEYEAMKQRRLVMFKTTWYKYSRRCIQRDICVKNNVSPMRTSNSMIFHAFNRITVFIGIQLFGNLTCSAYFLSKDVERKKTLRKKS